jgi:hypothetical protein
MYVTLIRNRGQFLRGGVEECLLCFRRWEETGCSPRAIGGLSFLRPKVAK